MSIDLLPTEKIIKKVKELRKDFFMVTFKYEENISHDDLIRKAKGLLKEYPIIIANRNLTFDFIMDCWTPAPA